MSVASIEYLISCAYRMPLNDRISTNSIPQADVRPDIGNDHETP